MKKSTLGLCLIVFSIISCANLERENKYDPESEFYDKPFYSVGFTVSGLFGEGLTLRNNDTDDFTVLVDGEYVFSVKIEDESKYNVTVFVQPKNPNQTCTVNDGIGMISGANVDNVKVICSTHSHKVGGSVADLTGDDLVLQNNGADDILITENGAFIFPAEVAEHAGYDVTVLSQPVNLSQTCIVTNGSGMMDEIDINDVEVFCTTNTYIVSVDVSGLSGSGLILQNNGGDNLAVAVNGLIPFSVEIEDGGIYNVTVFSQPTGPSQTCSISNGNGVIDVSPVSDITVTCSTDAYTVGGTVSGLSGDGLVLQNNGGDDLTIFADGSFTFDTAVADMAVYDVTVFSQPTVPSQTCLISNGSNSISGTDVTNVSVSCTTDTFTVGGTVSGLSGSGLVLQNNGGGDLPISDNGGFTFSTPIADMTGYSISIFSQPSGPEQTCTVTNESGTISAGNVTDVTVTCFLATKDITSFVFEVVNNPVLGSDIAGTVGLNTVDATVPFGTDISGLVPTIIITGVSVSPNSGTAQFFVDGVGVTYTVTAEDSSTTEYTVTVNITPPSTEKDITSFIFEAGNNPAISFDITAIIGADTIDATVPSGTDISSLIPTIVITGVSVNPGSGIVQAFIDGVGVTYSVAAEDSSFKDYTATLNILNIEIISVPANVTGFAMGHTGMSYADPVHTVASISAFRIGKYEIKYEEWLLVKTWAESVGYVFVNNGTMGDGSGDTDQHPVTNVSWRNAITWCNALSEWEGLTPIYYNAGQPHTNPNIYINSSTGGDIANTDVEWTVNGYRLPTDAEWEYAARYIDGISFTQGNWPSGATGSGQEDTYVWYNANSGSSTHEVGTKLPNALGIYDMNGNVWEWVWDWFGFYTTSSPYTDADTRGPASGTSRVFRGGSWLEVFISPHTAVRNGNLPTHCVTDRGFRIVRNP